MSKEVDLTSIKQGDILLGSVNELGRQTNHIESCDSEPTTEQKFTRAMSANEHKQQATAVYSPARVQEQQEDTSHLTAQKKAPESMALHSSHQGREVGDRHLRPAGGEHAKVEIIGLLRSELIGHLAKIGVPERQLKMRTAQLWHWLYVRGADSFAQMFNIAKDLRDRLEQYFTITYPEIVEDRLSVDGTRKWLFRFASNDPRIPDHIEIETVYIPQEDRGTLCVSSQVGCTLNCSFCHTGTQKLVRNLTAHEILVQLLQARRLLGDFPGAQLPIGSIVPKQGRYVSNIVMMGMGEPLYNFPNVKKALLIASDGDGLSLSKRRITLSTSGVVPMIEVVGRELGVMLAISLHAVRDDLRNELVPINRKYPIAQLLDACRNYPGLSNARRITFEYVMLKDVNDSISDAKQLVKLLHNIPAKINLIPFNSWPGSRYQRSSDEQIKKFADVLSRAGYASPVRAPRGEDIFAACGQLKSETEKIRASQMLI